MQLNPISKLEAARYMGVKGIPDTQISELLDKNECIVRKRITPKYVFREAAFYYDNDELFIDGMPSPLTGKDIKNHLNGCNKVILLAATLTSEADKLIRQTEFESIADALAVDCLCSAAIEQVCDRAEEEIFQNVAAPYRTWRFSPGYGDLSLTLQKDLLLFLNASRRIGLTSTDNSLLIPSKSVTAIIGLSDKPIKKNATGCTNCNMRDNCKFKKSGTCHN